MLSTKRISAESSKASFPLGLLTECQTGLALFAAAFYGRNDSIHFLEAGLVGTCVDTDGEKLGAMRLIYPVGWDFHVADAWVWAKQQREAGKQWDIVVADTFTGSVLEDALQSLDLWCSLARKAMLVSFANSGDHLSVDLPRGWDSWLHRRSDLASWLVLEKTE